MFLILRAYKVKVLNNIKIKIRFFFSFKTPFRDFYLHLFKLYRDLIFIYIVFIYYKKILVLLWKISENHSYCAFKSENSLTFSNYNFQKPCSVDKDKLKNIYFYNT